MRIATREPFFTLLFIGGMASPLFLFLAGVASAMSAASKARRAGSHRAGAAAARRRGWEIFALGLVFRVQAQLLGLGPLANLFKVDMLNTMGLSIVGARRSCGSQRTVAARASRCLPLLTAGISHRDATCPRDAMAGAAARSARGRTCGRPGPMRRFRCFRGPDFSLAGALVGDLVDAARVSPRNASRCCRSGLSLIAGAGDLAGVARVVSARGFPNGALLARFADVLLHPAGPRATLGADRVGRRAMAAEWRPAAARDARPVVAVRVLDPHRDGLRRHRRAASSARCRSGAVAAWARCS